MVFWPQEPPRGGGGRGPGRWDSAEDWTGQETGRSRARKPGLPPRERLGRGVRLRVRAAHCSTAWGPRLWGRPWPFLPAVWASGRRAPAPQPRPALVLGRRGCCVRCPRGSAPPPPGEMPGTQAQSLEAGPPGHQAKPPEVIERGSGVRVEAVGGVWVPRAGGGGGGIGRGPHDGTMLVPGCCADCEPGATGPGRESHVWGTGIKR